MAPLAAVSYKLLPVAVCISVLKVANPLARLPVTGLPAKEPVDVILIFVA